MEGGPQLEVPGRTEPETQRERGKATAPQQKDTRWVIERIQESFEVRAP